MEMSGENLFILLESAIHDGCHEELFGFLLNNEVEQQYIHAIINKIGNDTKKILTTELDFQSKITNILNIILSLAEIAEIGPEQSECLTRCLLSIAVDKSCSIYNLKHVLTMLKTFFQDEHVMNWSSTDESLFVPLKLLGVKLTEIGDYECQFMLLETLWLISEADRFFWADMWFSNQKTRSMFLNLNADQFVLDSRKFQNFINRNENKRTFAFVATSVSLGSIQLRKPYKSDFWIDFNYDSESISFSCSSLDVENDETTWETIAISSDMVEGYCVQNKKSSKTKELSVTLDRPCSQLFEDTSIPGLESRLVRISFWSFLDIQHHTEATFNRNYSDPVENVSDSQPLKQQKRASESIDLVCFNEPQKRVPSSQKQQRRASEPIELLYASFPEETVASSQNYKHRRSSESTELVCSSYPQEKRTKSHNRKQRRVSESSTLIAVVDLEHSDDNDTETEAHIPDNDLTKRKYTHSKKVVGGYGDSEQMNRNVHLTTDCMEEETIELQNCSNAMRNRKKPNGNVYEEHDVIDGVNNNLSLSKHQSQEHIEINAPFKVLQKSNAFEMSSDDDHDSLHNQEFSREERLKTKISFDRSSQSLPNRTHNLHSPGSSRTLQRKSPQGSFGECSQSRPKRSQNAELLVVSNASKRKSSQVSVDRFLQSTPKRSQNAELISASNTSKRKSSQGSVDRFLQSTPKKCENAELHRVSKKSNRKSPQLSPIITVNANHVQQQVSPEVVDNGYQLEEENMNDFNIHAETDDYQTSIDKRRNINLQSKKHKIIVSKKKKPEISREENYVRPLEAEENENALLSEPQKTHRRAAVKARKRNKLILEQKGSETSFSGSQQTHRQNRIDGLSQETEDNYNFAPSTSKEKALLPRKRNVVERKKINKADYQKKTAKSKLQRDKKSFKTHKLSSRRSKTSDSESRSKTAFSELDRFSLVIEKDHKILPANDLSGLYQTLNYDRNLRQSSIEDNNIQQDYSKELDVANENENSIEYYENNESQVSENKASNAGMKRSQKTKYKTFPPSTYVEVSDVTNESTVLSRNKRNMKSTKSLGRNKDPTKEFCKGKKRLANTIAPKHNAKRSKNIESSVSNDLDSITLFENRSKSLKRNSCQGSEKNVSCSITKSQSTSNKTPNIPISLETIIEVSPFKRDTVIGSGRWISPNKIENPYERPILENKKYLTEESLSSFNDEKQGKRIHLEHFLESLSSVSPNPQILDISEVPELSPTLEKSKTKHQKSISRKDIEKDHFSKKKQQSSENHYSDLTQEEYNIGSLSLTSKSLQNVEEEDSEKEIPHIEPSESSFQEPPAFQEKHTKAKMPRENYLPMKPSVLHILGDEVSTLTTRLFQTLKKCMSDFREKMVALRVSIINTADSMLSNESKFTEKDLGSLVRSCRESRIHIQKHLKKLNAMGMEYFESEQLLEKRLAKKHKKAVLKYTKNLQIAQSIADKALEERFILKSRAFLKNFLKKMELV